MELVNTESLGPVIADTWRTLTTPAAGPGAFVFLVDAPLDDTDTMQVQVQVNPAGAGTWAVVEDVATVPTDLSSFSGVAGFQSSPVPLVDGTWAASVRTKHDSATDITFTVRVIKL